MKNESKKYSRTYKVGKDMFRYNYEKSLLEWVCKPTADMLEDNKECQAEMGKDLWDIVDGYAVIDSIGLRRDNWKDSPKYWCERYADEIREECAWIARYER